MLSKPAMLRALATVAVLAIPSAASAGVYVSLGLGTTGVSDDSKGVSAGYAFHGNGRSGRVAVGYRFAPFHLGSVAPAVSVEGGYAGYGVESDGYAFGANSFFAAGKLSVPMPFAPGFEVYGRLGVQHSSFSIDNSSQGASFDNGNGSQSGDGLLAGLGLEFRFGSGISSIPPVLANSSVWVDYTYDDNNMTNAGGESRGIPVDMLTLGVTFGF